MFKGLRQKIGQGLATTPARGVVPHALQEASPILPLPSAEVQQNNSRDNAVLNDDPNATPSGSLINLNDDDDGDSTKVSLQQEQIDYLSAGFSGPAVLEISGSGSHISDLKSPHNRVPRSRTSSVSSQASDSYFVSPPAFPSRQLPLPSDVESITSEAEDAGVSLDLISKEELYRCYCRMQQRSTKYRWKFSQILKTYKEMEKEREKLRDTMTKSQDKAFRRISELKEQIQLDQLAKFDLEQNYMLMLEEKDEVVKVLRTQVTLLKQGKEVPEEMVQRGEGAASKSAKTDDNGVADYQDERVLEKKIARMSSLLRASKESITKNRDQVQKLNAENSRLMESIETARVEKEHLQAAVDKKDQEFGTLVEKLKSELLKLSDQPNEVSLTVPDLSDFNFYDQIEHLHRTLLSHVAIIQVQRQASQEQLVTKDAENHKLHSENKRLLEEIADQKCALEKSLSCEKSVDRVYESANAAAEQNICLCSKHRPYVMANVLSVGESTSVRQEIVKNCGVTEANQTSELPELGAGEFVPHHDFLCVVCEKESQLVLANEKIRSSHDRISQLEEMVSQLRLDCEPQNGCVDKISEAGNENHLETDSDERIKTALKSVEENHCLEMTCLREKIECLESQLREVSDTHRLKTDDTDRRHQMELEELQRRFDTESEQMSLRLSKELENLKEEITQLERELLRQREANELSEKSTEIIKLEMHSQKQCFETRLATIIEEKQNLEEELQMAGERNQIVSAALKDVQTLKASLVKSVQEIVKRTMQEERGVTADTENAAEIKSNEVRQNLDSERDLYAKGEEEEKEMVMKMQAGEGNILKESRLKDGGLRAGDDVEELENKNDVLHLLLHDWQGCVQMLKNCLVEKEAECHVLETDLQEAQVTMQTLRTQLVEDNEKWHSRMEETKELHRQELNYIEEEIKNRIAAKEMGLAGNDEKWQATMEEVQKSHKKELNCLQEEIKNLIAIKEAELSGNEDQWKAKIEEVKEFYKAELNHLHEEIKSLIAIKETELAGNEDIWKSKMEEVRELNKEEISRLEEDFKKQISVKEADLIGIEEKWKGTMEEVLLLHKEELIRLKEDFRNQTTTKEGEFALENEKWEARMEGVKEQYQTELNRLGEEIKSLNVTKGTELVGNDEKWRAKLEEVTMVHKEELNRFEEEIKKLIAARGLEFALDGEKWQDRLEEAKKLHTEELNRLEEEKKDLVSTKERELADLQTSLREEKDIAANETEKLRNDLVVLEDKNGQLSDQLNASEKQIENLLMTMHDLKNLKDAEEDTLRRNLQEAMQMAEKTVEDRIQSLNEQKDALQEQLQELKQDSEVQLERLRSRNEDLASELRTVKLQEDKLLEDIRELELMNKKLKMQHDHLENELKFLQEELIELKVRREEAAEGEKSLADKLWLTEEQCKAAENQIEKLKNLESTQQTKIQELLVQRDSDKEAFQGLRDENGELRNELKILKEQGSSSKKLQKALKVLKDKNESLSLHVKELEEQKNSIQTELQEIKEQHGSVCKEVEEQKSNIEKDLQEFKDKNDALIEQMKALEHEKDSLFNELQEWKDNKGSLDEQIKTLEEQRDVSQKELLEHKDRIVALCEQVKETEEQKELISRNVKELEEQLEQMQKQLQDLKDQNGILKIQLEDTEKNKQSDLQEMAQQGSRILEDADILRTEVMRLSSLTATLENQLKQSEADSVSQINKLEEELEKMKAEAEMQKEVAQQAEEKVKELRDLSEMLSMEKVRKDYEVKEVKERSAEIEAGYRLELFELRKYLCALLNPEMSLVDETEGQAEEIAVLRKVVETELSSHLLGLNTRIDMLSKQSYDVAMKADELTEQLNAAEKKRLEEELILKAKQSDLEVRNGELRSEIEKLNILVNELQDQSNGFALTQAVHDRTISEKDRLLKESEEKLKIMSQEGDLKQMKLLSNLEELQGKVTMLSDQSTENEKIASASQQRLSELAESLTKSESCLREAEEKLDTLSAEHETERKRLMAIIEELSNKSAEGASISEENALLLKSMEERLKHDADEHERLFTNLKLDFDALQEDLSTKTEQVIEFENTLAEKDLRLKEVEENLTGKITDSEREIERLHDRVKELEDLMTHTEGNVQETVRKINESKALELEEKTQNLEKLYKIKVEHLEGVILSHENRVETLTESLLVFEKTKETLEAENDQLKLRVAEQLQNISATHDDMLKKLDVAYCECKNKDADILELRKTSEERGKILGELQEILTVKEQEIEKMRLQLSDAEGKIQLSLASEELIAELQDRVKIESEEHKSQVDRLETENETQRNELSRVISENEVARSEIDRLKVEIGEHRRETNSLQIKNEESLSEFNGLKVKYDEHESEISILQAENKELNTEINRLNDKIMDLERERSDLFLEKTKAIEEKDAAWKGLEEKLLERSELETKKDEDHRKEMEATETRLLEKIKELQRKFVIKLKAVQNENEKLVRGVNTENEELRLSKSGLEMQLDNIRKVADERLRTADELQFRLSELQKCQADAVQKTDECVVEKHHEDLMKKSHEVLAEQTKVELAVNSHKGAEELSDQQQVHENSSCDASVEKQQLENSVLEIRNQLEQALSVANEAQLKMEKSEKIVLELNESIDMLKNEIDELKVKNAEELRVQTERLEAECSEKLGELKKKAEMRLKQIKNQIQTERDASIAEVIKVRDNLTEQLSTANGELLRQTELLREKEEEIQRLKNSEDKQIEETCSLREALEASKQQLREDLHAKDNILEELKGRHQSLEDEAERLRQTIVGLKEEDQLRSDKLTTLETNCKGLKKQLVSAKREIDRINSEKDVEVRAAQLDKETEVARLMSEYKEQLKDLEIDNNSRIKQLVKEFQQKLAEKENEFQSTYMESVEKGQREEDVMIHQHRQELKAMRLELREKEESFEESIEQMEVQLQAAEMQLEEEKKKSFAEAELLKQNIERLEKELLESQRANVTSSIEHADEDEPALQPEKVSLVNVLGASASDSSAYINEQLQQDVINLTRQIEELKIRYSLQVIKDQALDSAERTDDGMETTDGSQQPIEQNQLQTLELHNMDLQAQVVQQCGDIARLKIRERSLQHEVEVLTERIGSRTSDCESGMSELPSTTQSQPHVPTELQYLKNVLLKFMTGTEQQTLARVICTVLKFSEEETQEVMNHLYNELF